jgi:hypothetical protein
MGNKIHALPVTRQGRNFQVKYSFSSSKFCLCQLGLGRVWYLQDKLIKNKFSLSSNRVEFDTDPQYGHLSFVLVLSLGLEKQKHLHV